MFELARSLCFVFFELHSEPRKLTQPYANLWLAEGFDLSRPSQSLFAFSIAIAGFCPMQTYPEWKSWL